MDIKESNNGIVIIITVLIYVILKWYYVSKVLLCLKEFDGYFRNGETKKNHLPANDR